MGNLDYMVVHRDQGFKTLTVFEVSSHNQKHTSFVSTVSPRCL